MVHTNTNSEHKVFDDANALFLGEEPELPLIHIVKQEANAREDAHQLRGLEGDSLLSPMGVRKEIAIYLGRESEGELFKFDSVPKKKQGDAEDLGEEKPKDDIKIETKPFSQQLLTFSGYILLILCVIYLLAAGVFIALPDSKNAAAVWDNARTSLYTIAVLVLGYYFGKKST